MALKFRGQVTLANGSPISQGVTDMQVQVFDHDPGQGNDDELTVEPGIADETGRFTVKINPSRFLDFDEIKQAKNIDLQFDETHWTPNPMFDLPQPYMQFNYRFLGNPRSFQALMRPFQHKFRLPQLPPVPVTPSANGFRFVNSFPPFDPPFSLPDWLRRVKIGSNYGLCGGMSSAVYDFALAARPAPELADPPKTGTRLHRYLIRRSIDTFGLAGEHLAKVGRWSLRPDEGLYGTHRLTMDELPRLLQLLDDKQSVVIAQVRVHAKNHKELAQQIWNNHQVLAVGYERPNPNEINIQLYEPNFRNRDDLRLLIESYQVGVAALSGGELQPVFGARSQQIGPANRTTQVRGFFPMSYQAVVPPKGL